MRVRLMIGMIISCVLGGYAAEIGDDAQLYVWCNEGIEIYYDDGADGQYVCDMSMPIACHVGDKLRFSAVPTSMAQCSSLLYWTYASAEGEDTSLTTSDIEVEVKHTQVEIWPVYGAEVQVESNDTAGGTVSIEVIE